MAFRVPQPQRHMQSMPTHPPTHPPPVCLCAVPACLQDCRLADAYMLKYLNETLLEGMQLFPGFYTPPSTMPHPQARRLLLLAQC